MIVAFAKMCRMSPLYARRQLTAGLMLAMTAALGGCSGADWAVQRTTENVSSISVGDPGEVNATVLASAMLRAGFTRAEILDQGPRIRRALATKGGAEARRDGEMIALFSHKEGALYVTSAQSGTFVRQL